MTGDHAGIVTKNGLFRPIALVDGRAAGIWRMPKGRSSFEPFGQLPRPVRDALAAEAADVERFLAASPRATADSGTSQMAPSSVQQRTMSRIETTPATSPPSRTTRWRKPPRIIATAASSSDQSGAA